MNDQRGADQQQSASPTVAGYGIGQIFRDAPAVLLPSFMTTMLGVPAWFSGIVILIPKLWLIACDPLVGVWSDRVKYRRGRTPFLLWRAILTAAIPANTNSDMREKLESLYRFANEPSLKQRLRAIIPTLTQAFSEAPGRFNGKFLRKLVETRNSYTHYPKELSERTLDGGGMYWATSRVILLLTLLFLQRIRLAAADIKPLLERHRELAQLWAKADRPQ